MLILMYCGEYIFFKESFSLEDEQLRKNGIGTKKLELLTILYYTFTLMTLFNQFNCRINDDTRFNIFANLGKNYYFIIIIVFEFFITFGI